MTRADSHIQNQAGGDAEGAGSNREARGSLRPDTGGRTKTARVRRGEETPTQLPNQGSLTGGPATETLSCLSSEGLPWETWPGPQEARGSRWSRHSSQKGLAADIQLHDGLVIITNTLSLSKLPNPDLFISENCFHQDTKLGSER